MTTRKRQRIDHDQASSSTISEAYPASKPSCGADDIAVSSSLGEMREHKKRKRSTLDGHNARVQSRTHTYASILTGVAAKVLLTMAQAAMLVTLLSLATYKLYRDRDDEDDSDREVAIARATNDRSATTTRPSSSTPAVPADAPPPYIEAIRGKERQIGIQTDKLYKTQTAAVLSRAHSGKFAKFGSQCDEDLDYCDRVDVVAAITERVQGLIAQANAALLPVEHHRHAQGHPEEEGTTSIEVGSDFTHPLRHSRIGPRVSRQRPSAHEALITSKDSKADLRKTPERILHSAIPVPVSPSSTRHTHRKRQSMS
ncbi:hypothetical protein EMMF5_003197 [Cystobasidiomycetes sp. EMM_F5]